MLILQTTEKRPSQTLQVRLYFVVAVLCSGIAIGTLTSPGEWYAELNKPFFNPPNWVFGPVWTVLYVLIAVAGWRQFEARRKGSHFTLWCIQLGLNFLWSPAFFSLQNPWLAFIVIVALFLSILLFINRSWSTDKISALIFVPYLAWVNFATALNLSIAILN
ncbi:TspO/MBR family protein [Pseudopelagicola sp. nBUS_20]|uniref:TspO/MBR family protein n=1 Tax=Pseudopelagicola sp. nBUS_20 TaxID=3395317 RepID=UPI003EC03656